METSKCFAMPRINVTASAPLPFASVLPRLSNHKFDCRKNSFERDICQYLSNPMGISQCHSDLRWCHTLLRELHDLLLNLQMDWLQSLLAEARSQPVYGQDHDSQTMKQPSVLAQPWHYIIYSMFLSHLKGQRVLLTICENPCARNGFRSLALRKLAWCNGHWACIRLQFIWGQPAGELSSVKSRAQMSFRAGPGRKSLCFLAMLTASQAREMRQQLLQWPSPTSPMGFFRQMKHTSSELNLAMPSSSFLQKWLKNWIPQIIPSDL